MVGDHFLPKISPTKGNMWFGARGKPSRQYIGLFDVLDCIGQVAYHLALLPHLSIVHPVFHVSMLKEYRPNNSHIVSFLEIELHPDLMDRKDVVNIVDHWVKTLRRKEVPLELVH